MDSGAGAARKQWLTVAEVAELLDLSRATVYRLIADRRLGHVRVSNCVKVHVDQLRVYVEQRAQS